MEANNIKLSNKSDATHLLKLLNPSPVRDKIMDWLMPADVVNLMIASGIRFGEADEAKYTSASKLVITDRRWLIRQMDAGFKFTVVCPNLKTIAAEGQYSYTGDSFCLVVTRNEKFVPCTSEFADKSVFQQLACSEEAVEEIIMDYVEPATRIIKVPVSGTKNTIMCPLVSQKTDLIMFLNMKLYIPCLTLTDEAGNPITWRTQFMHLNKHRCTITTAENKYEDDYTFEEAALNMFSIESGDLARLDLGFVLYRIPKIVFGPQEPARILGIIR